MGKVIAIGPGGRAQAPARDDRCRPVVEAVRDHGLLDELLISPACTTIEDAAELKTAMYRSARYFCSCGINCCTRKHGNVPPDGCPRGGQRISCRAEVVTVTDPQTGRKRYAVEFQLFDKAEAIREVVRKYGPDPDRWPYFARRKQLKEK